MVEAGEKMSWGCVRAFADNTAANAVLWNSYGASEASSTLWPCPRDHAQMEDVNSSVPIPVGDTLQSGGSEYLHYGSGYEAVTCIESLVMASFCAAAQ